jgi:hypothetical protein
MSLIGNAGYPRPVIHRIQDSIPVAGGLHPAIYRSSDNAHIERHAGAFAAVFTYITPAGLLILPPAQGNFSVEALMAQHVVLGHIHGVLPGYVVQRPDPLQ